MAKSGKTKKPFYKKIWFWLLAGILVIGGCMDAGESSDDTSETTVPTSSYVAETTEPTTVPETTVLEATVAETTEETAPATAVASTSAPTEKEEYTYILNTSSKKFHLQSCSSVDTIKESNKTEFTGTREELIDKGYEPCGRCKP